MTDTARDNLVLLVFLASVLLLICATGLFVAVRRMLHEDKPKPTPKAARHNPTLTGKAAGHIVPRAPDPVIVIPALRGEVVFQPGQVKPDYGDETEVRTRPYDLTIVASPEAARRARGWS